MSLVTSAATGALRGYLPRKIARLGSSRHGNRFAEFVRARNPYFAGRIFLKIENERSAIVMTAAARIPVAVRHGADAFVILRQTQQRGVDGLFFRADKPRSEERRVGKE